MVVIIRGKRINKNQNNKRLLNNNGIIGTAIFFDPTSGKTYTLYIPRVTSATVGVVYIYNIVAADPDRDTITYSIITKPKGMNINSSTGAITWNPITSGSFGVTVEVSDGDLSVLYSFNITVSTLSEIVVYRALCVGVGDFSEADNNDITYFYFSGHGFYLDNTAYLCPAGRTYFFGFIH